jgi:glycosyltransferase involved in cell wall biosynthesis
MKQKRKSVCLISSGLVNKKLPLQPWRYLHEIARQLMAQGHRVTAISDGTPRGEEVGGVLVRRVQTVNRFHWQENLPLQSAVEEIDPDLILWHLGLPSFLHQQLRGWPNVPVVGIFPGLIYRPQELLRLGIKRLIQGHQLSAIHILGTLVPKQLLRRAVHNGRLRCLVAQTQTTGQRLLESGLRPEQVKVIGPGVDKIWSDFQLNGHESMRAELGYGDSDRVVLYFGSPASLRGLHTLIRAVKIARRTEPSLKLLILNRRRVDELLREDAELRQLLSESAMKQHVKVVSGFLAKDVLVRHVAACDVVALPFELVPADAPLSILEAQALGKPVVTTKVASLPELASQGVNYLAEPADPYSLAQALQQAVQSSNKSNGAAPSKHLITQPAARSWQQMGKEWSHLIQTL